MEDKVFPSSAVADLMQQQIVEGRLHTDAQNTLTPAQFARNRELQASIAGTRANPYFVIVDPATGKKIAEHALSGGWTTWYDSWATFVADTAKAVGRSR
jgi:hypothetical protein